MYELTATKVHSIFSGEKRTNRVTVEGLREDVSDDDAGDEMQEGWMFLWLWHLAGDIFDDGADDD